MNPAMPQGWAGAAPGYFCMLTRLQLLVCCLHYLSLCCRPRLQGACTQSSITETKKQECCTAKTTKFKDDITGTVAVHGITRGVSEWCTGVDDGIEAQVYPGPIVYTTLPNGVKRFDHNSNSTHAMDRWAYFNFVALLVR